MPFNSRIGRYLQNRRGYTFMCQKGFVAKKAQLLNLDFIDVSVREKLSSVNVNC